MRANPALPSIGIMASDFNPCTIRAAEAFDRLGNGSLDAVDCRWYLDGRSGVDAYTAGHISGAAFADIDSHLADLSIEGQGRHPLPSEDQFVTALLGIGVDPASQIVAYDDVGGSIAARLWWMGTQLGMKVRVLDGGIQGWEYGLESGPSKRQALKKTTFSRGEKRFADGILTTDELAESIRTNTICVLDARAAERYQGNFEPIDPRSGHIPSAISFPSANLLDSSKHFLDQVAIESLFGDAVDLQQGQEIVASCGSGITACHLILASQHATGVRPLLYAGSFSAWSRRDDLDVATGSDPGSLDER